MSVNSVNSLAGGQSTSEFVQQLVSAIDGNQDGQITSTELGSFLTALLGAVSSTGKNQTADASASASTEDEARSDPSTWTDNNAPYGVTLAGFDPQNHTDLTLADLGTPGKAEKYAVYEYLVANKIQPTTSWAPAAAEALNARYNTTVYHAIDGETLGYGYEYVHTAPNGHGMPQGTYDPNATGEFLWGCYEPEGETV